VTAAGTCCNPYKAAAATSATPTATNSRCVARARRATTTTHASTVRDRHRDLSALRWAA